MIKILSLLAISTSVFYLPNINAHKYNGEENHIYCEYGTFTNSKNKQKTNHHGYNEKTDTLMKC